MAERTKQAKETNGKHVNRIADIPESEDESLGVPSAMKMEMVVFNIIGISPLIQNNPLNFIGKTEGDALATKKVYKDEEEAALRVYLDADGAFYHPAVGFLRAMIRGVTGKKFGKLAATSLLKGSVFLAEPHAALVDKNGKPLTKYAIDRQPVVVGTARVLRCRPCWNDWCAKVALEIDTAIIRPEQVKEALALGGRIAGVGDNRPETGGGNGRFRVG
jgi:hypothetical protein